MAKQEASSSCDEASSPCYDVDEHKLRFLSGYKSQLGNPVVRPASPSLLLLGHYAEIRWKSQTGRDPSRFRRTALVKVGPGNVPWCRVASTVSHVSVPKQHCDGVVIRGSSTCSRSSRSAFQSWTIANLKTRRGPRHAATGFSQSEFHYVPHHELQGLG
ncbi:hypothetical protein HPB47_014154 [Ixodes persulcatus]|uniref:Uncharacterized protein n=1 Tax=Ixodes persulcatus TaxID=34615 RepID=A0AC60QWL7_IXOPE|nr:hypothetical protein HPB47_014154 [Ixodes persulcatus]